MEEDTREARLTTGKLFSPHIAVLLDLRNMLLYVSIYSISDISNTLEVHCDLYTCANLRYTFGQIYFVCLRQRHWNFRVRTLSNEWRTMLKGAFHNMNSQQNVPIRKALHVIFLQDSRNCLGTRGCSLHGHLPRLENRLAAALVRFWCWIQNQSGFY